MASYKESQTDTLRHLDKPDNSGWSASLYNKNASFVYSAAYTNYVLDLLAAQPGERILDVGCGSGEVTLTIQNIVEQQEGGLVLGTDLSSSMVSAVSFEISALADKIV